MTFDLMFGLHPVYSLTLPRLLSIIQQGADSWLGDVRHAIRVMHLVESAKIHYEMYSILPVY
jgi:hypothetical protein